MDLGRRLLAEIEHVSSGGLSATDDAFFAKVEQMPPRARAHAVRSILLAAQGFSAPERANLRCGLHPDLGHCRVNGVGTKLMLSVSDPIYKKGFKNPSAWLEHRRFCSDEMCFNHLEVQERSASCLNMPWSRAAMRFPGLGDRKAWSSEVDSLWAAAWLLANGSVSRCFADALVGSTGTHPKHPKYSVSEMTYMQMDPDIVSGKVPIPRPRFEGGSSLDRCRDSFEFGGYEVPAYTPFGKWTPIP